MSLNNPAETCLIVRLTLACWEGKKNADDIAAEVADSKRADRGTAKVSKVMLPGGTGSELALLRSQLDAARAYHYANTLRWISKGEQLISQMHFFTYKEAMSTFEQRCRAALEVFVEAYPQRMQEARVALGDMYNEEDYPTVAEIRARFRFKTVLYPVPRANQLARVIGEDLAAQTAQEVNDAFKSAMTDAFERLHKAVAHAHAKLADPDGVFRNSLTGNLKELAEILPALNVTQDPRLTELVEDLNRALAGRSPDDLREDQRVRASAAHDYEAILKKMKSYQI